MPRRRCGGAVFTVVSRARPRSRGGHGDAGRAGWARRAVESQGAVAAALANCFHLDLTGMARAQGVELGEIETNRLDAAGVGRRLPPPPVGGHAAHHRLVAGAGAKVRELIADAEAHCPVCQAIAGRVALRVTADARPRCEIGSVKA